MSNRPVVPISDLERIQRESPESLAVVRVIVYDKSGTPSKIRAYELDRFLALGFTVDPPAEELRVPVEEFTPFTLPERRHMVQSFRGGH